MTKYEALKLALEALEADELDMVDDGNGNMVFRKKQAIVAVKEALAQPAQEPVTILPNGSAFGVMYFPLPDDHWLYAPNEYRDGEYEPIDLPKPILTHALRESVVAAVRYAVRGATMRGQETDFDPDALVQNAVYALCGPYTTPPQRPWVGLTDEQILHKKDTYVSEPSIKYPLSDFDWLNFARAIEAAHGIGEKK